MFKVKRPRGSPDRFTVAVIFFPDRTFTVREPILAVTFVNFLPVGALRCSVILRRLEQDDGRPMTSAAFTVEVPGGVVTVWVSVTVCVAVLSSALATSLSHVAAE